MFLYFIISCQILAATTECQCWQDFAKIWQNIKIYRKTRMSSYYLDEFRELV